MSFWKEPIQSNNQRCDSQIASLSQTVVIAILKPNENEGGNRYDQAGKDNRVPLWERMNLTLEEAAAYTGIGTDKLRELSNRESCDFVLWVGTKRLLKRKQLEEFLIKSFSI